MALGSKTSGVLKLQFEVLKPTLFFCLSNAEPLNKEHLAQLKASDAISQLGVSTRQHEPIGQEPPSPALQLRNHFFLINGSSPSLPSVTLRIPTRFRHAMRSILADHGSFQTNSCRAHSYDHSECSRFRWLTQSSFGLRDCQSRFAI